MAVCAPTSTKLRRSPTNFSQNTRPIGKRRNARALESVTESCSTVWYAFY